jgi:hypothetical protein
MYGCWRPLTFKGNSVDVASPAGSIRRLSVCQFYLTALNQCSTESVTYPVLYSPTARAAAGDRSMSLPRTQGPRSLMRTVTHVSRHTRTSVPKGNLRCAAVIAVQLNLSPLAVL